MVRVRVRRARAIVAGAVVITLQSSCQNDSIAQEQGLEDLVVGARASCRVTAGAAGVVAGAGAPAGRRRRRTLGHVGCLGSLLMLRSIVQAYV